MGILKKTGSSKGRKENSEGHPWRFSDYVGLIPGQGAKNHTCVMVKKKLKHKNRSNGVPNSKKNFKWPTAKKKRERERILRNGLHLGRVLVLTSKTANILQASPQGALACFGDL